MRTLFDGLASADLAAGPTFTLSDPRPVQKAQRCPAAILRSYVEDVRNDRAA